MTPAWEVRVGRGTDGAIAFRDSVFYVGDADRRVYAVDLHSGRVRWSNRLPGAVFGGVVGSGDTLFAGTDRPNAKVLALRAGDGHKVWERSVGKLSAPLALIDNRLLAPLQDGRLVSLDPTTGATVWERRLGQARARAVGAAPDTMVLATIDSIVVMTTREGRVLGRIASPGTIIGGWTRAGRHLLAGTTDSLLIAFDHRSRTLAWTAKLDAAILTEPVVEGDTAYVVSRIGTLYRVELAPQPSPSIIAALEWPVTASPVAFGPWILVGGADGVIRAIDRSGQEAWRLGLWQPIRVPPVVLGDGLLAIGGTGDFHLYREPE